MPTYTLFDAAVIVLREGLEALLVLVALLTFLKKSGQAHLQRWIWFGAGLGLALAVLLGFGVQVFFRQLITHTRQEVFVGITGLLAAILLFSVSYWLHRQASLASWKHFIQEEATTALATGRVFSLVLLAFMAVFREGAETVLFYLGMAASITTADLWAGLGVGSLALAGLGVVIVQYGVKLPLTPFFRVLSLLIVYLGIKFLGSGLHALQVAEWLKTTTISGIPKIGWLSFYPTWETASAQTAVLIAVALILGWQRWQTARIEDKG